MAHPEWWPGEDHEAFTIWALENGVEALGVTPARFPGRGLGMMATRKIKKGEAVVQVPTSVILTMEKLPLEFKDQFPEGTAVQTILAAYFTCGDDEELEQYALWRRAWPTRQDFEDSLPLLWPKELGGLSWPDSDTEKGEANGQTDLPQLLPPCISGHWSTVQKGSGFKEYESEHQKLLPAQQIRLRKAWADVSVAVPGIDWKSFSYHWLILNTRSFYWVAAGEEPPEDRNDAMAMLPFADYFNHANIECDVKFDEDGYTLRATEDYEEGDEVYMSYGGHPNDLLLAEYGFFLEHSNADCLYLDDIIFRDLDNKDKQEELWLYQYYGNYQLVSQGVCYRTEVAAALVYMSEEDWRSHVLEGSTKGLDENKSETIIKGWIQTYAAEADAAIASLQQAMKSHAVVKAHRQKGETLLRRWTQIKSICESGLASIDL